MAISERTPEAAPLSLEERTLVWFYRVHNHPREPKDNQSTENILTQGYQLFFEILEPFKDSEWIQAEHPDLHYRAWLNFKYDDRLSEFSELFGWLNDSWGVEIYGYKKRYLSDDVEASMRLSCGQQGTHGEKMIRVLYIPPSKGGFSQPHGQMYIEDTTASWLRWGAGGKLETVQEKNLYDYSGLFLCKLAVALAEGFVKKHAEKQQAEVTKTA